MRGTHGEVKRSEANVPGLGGGVLISSTQVLEGLSGAERAMRAVVATPAASVAPAMIPPEVPSLPAAVLDRPELLRELKQRVLDTSSEASSEASSA